MRKAGWVAVVAFALLGAGSMCVEMVRAQEEDPVQPQAQEEGEPVQPHTSDPKECVKYCYPPGYEGARPKGVPEGVQGYECKGDHCAKAMENNGEEVPCDENGQTHCSTYCAESCCSCLAVCS